MMGPKELGVDEYLNRRRQCEAMVKNGLLDPEDANAGDSLTCGSAAKHLHIILDIKSATERSSESTPTIQQVVEGQAARRSASMLVRSWDLLIDTLHRQSSW